MEFYALGVNHATAPVSVRGRFALTSSQKIELTSLLLDAGAAEVVILFTCNRSELFLFAPKDGFLPRVQALVLDYLHASDCEKHLFALTHRAAVLHLFRVTAGLDSVVVGEDQILGQVKQAQVFSAQQGSCGKMMNRLFRDAITLAKQIKTQTGISQIPLSVSYIGIKLLSQRLGGLAGRRFLVVGLGKMNRLSLQYLLDEQAEAIYLCSRNREKLQDAAQLSPRIVPLDFDKRYTLLNAVDAVITATGSPHTIFSRADLPELVQPLLFLDMAVPQDVSEELRELPGVEIFNVDDLRSISLENLARRQALVEEAEVQAGAATDAFLEWTLQTQVDPTIESLNHRCEAITADVSGYLATKLALSDRDKRLVTKMVASGLHRLLRDPVSKLKQARDLGQQDDYIRLVEELFNL